jgi:hypothetical protein
LQRGNSFPLRGVYLITVVRIGINRELSAPASHSYGWSGAVP